MPVNLDLRIQNWMGSHPSPVHSFLSEAAPIPACYLVAHPSLAEDSLAAAD